MGRPEADQTRLDAMNLLGNGLYQAGHDEDALSVQEAELSTLRRLGVSEAEILNVQNNIACSYHRAGRLEETMRMQRDVYTGYVKSYGEETIETLIAANNYANSLLDLKRFAEAKSVLRKIMPVARRVLGDNDETTLRMRWNYGEALWRADSATLDDIREAMRTLEDAGRAARRVLGGAHPTAVGIYCSLKFLREWLRACDTPSSAREDK